MNVQEVLLTRRTIHTYQPGAPLPDGALEAALEAAHHAPNHRLTVPWRFTLPGPVTRAALAELGLALKQTKRPDCDVAKIKRKLLDPAACVVVSQVLQSDPAIREEDYASVACAIQNLMLSLHARGVGTKWTTGKVTAHPDTYGIVGIDPTQERIVGWVWAGVAEQDPPTPDRRVALTDVIRRLP